MQNLIKISNPPLVEKLQSEGFRFISIERNGDNLIYVFPKSKEILDIIQNEYEMSTCFFENRLHF